MATVTRLAFTGDASADDFVSTNPLALLIGMLFDQQISMERAFAAPLHLARRLDTAFDATTIAWMSIGALDSCVRMPPALHRYPGMMARRVQALCAHLVEHHRGDAAAIWDGCDDGTALLRTVRALPGFGEHRAQVLVALLGKQMNVRPDAWQAAAGIYGRPGYRSIADVTDRGSLDRVRAFKRRHRRD